jgi:hypothetical protein
MEWPTDAGYVMDQHTCNAPAYHNGPACNPLSATVMDVVHASPDRLVELVKHPMSNVKYNPSRHSLQIIGCRSELIANIPLEKSIEVLLE